MNRYFYVPVIESGILHDGISLGDHLKMIDSELYEREQKYLELPEGSFFDTINQLSKINADRQNRKTDRLFKERSLPRFIVIVFNDNRFFEIASEVEIDPISFENIRNYEVLGMDVLDIFTDNPSYTPDARGFFHLYEQEKKKSDIVEKPKRFIKDTFFKR